MKIWIRILLGVIIGSLLGLFTEAGQTLSANLAFISDLVIRIGRYALLPLVFFSMVVGISDLKQEGKLPVIFGRTLISALLLSFLTTLVGLISVILVSPGRIPVIVQQGPEASLISFREILYNIFPSNLFQVFILDGNLFLPVMVLALFIGLNITFDTALTKPALHLFDSLSRIFYRINGQIINLIAIGMIPLSWQMVLELRKTRELALYRSLLLLTAVDVFIVIFLLFPFILYLYNRKKNPYRSLYAVLGPALTALVSGNSYLSLAPLIKHGKENLGIPRKIGSVTFPLFTIIGKSGTAMVVGITFVTILKSYSSLGITFSGALWIFGAVFLLSFMTGPYPGSGVFVCLAMLCALYGKGLEEGYLLVQPILPLLISLSVLLDSLSAAFLSQLTAMAMKEKKEIGPARFC